MKKSNKYITAKREINKKILKNTVQGFLKTTLSLLPVALSLSALSTGIVFSVKEGKAGDAIKDYPKSDQFIVIQSNDLMELDEKFNAGEIEPAEYLKGLQYLKSEEYFSEVMNKDQQYQTLLKNQNLYAKVGISTLVVGIVGLVLSLTVFGDPLSDIFDEGIDSYKNAGNLLVGKKAKLNQLKLTDDEDTNQIPDLDDEFYKKD